MNKLIPGVIGATVIVVLVALVLLPATESQDHPPEWTFDDYKLASDYSADEVSGAFELVTIGGEEYIHAKAVGEGSINGVSYNVQKADLDVVFIWGQSNATYRNAVVDEAVYPGLNAGYYFGTDSQLGSTSGQGEMDISTCSFYSLVDPEGDLRIGDMGPAIAKAYHEKTGHKVYLINGAIGNKWILLFFPGGQMWNYGGAMFSAGMDAIDRDLFNVHVVGYVWSQGEANAGNSVDEYERWFMMSFNSMRSGLMDDTRFPAVYIIKTREENGANPAQAQINLSKEYSNVILATTLPDSFTVANGLMYSDDLHYSQLGKNLIGEAVGESIADHTLPPASMNLEPYLVVIPILIIVATLMAFIGIAFRNRY